MTEEEWLACTRPDWLSKFLRDTASDRKCRLFAHACCKRVEHRFIDPSQHLAVQVAERCADGLATVEEIESAAAAVKRFDAVYFDENLPADEVAYRAAAVIAQAVSDQPLEELMVGPNLHWLDEVIWGTVSAAGHTVIEVEEAAGRIYGDSPDEYPDLRRGQDAEERILTNVLREIFGNPFRSVTFADAWRTTDAMMLAKGVYAEKAFDGLPVLADALQEAGCDADELLDHLRDTSATHVRGCWALDLVLGKE